MKTKSLSICGLMFLLASCVPSPVNPVEGASSGIQGSQPTSSAIESGDKSGDSSTTKKASFIPEVGEVKLLFSPGKPEETRLYNYCPSIFIDSDGDEHVYFCTNKVEGNVTDYIGYRKGSIVDGSISYTDVNYVMEHSDLGNWDSRHNCDPSVVKGEFKYKGETYNYLMAFLGCLTSDSTRNETGIAVSKSPSGPWVKCNSLKSDGVTPINPIVPYAEFQVGESGWGTGQPSLVSVDKKGKVLLFTTVGASNGTFTNLREYDFSDIDNYVLLRQRNSISSQGIRGTVSGATFINNADFAYDEVNRRIILSKPRQYFGTDGKNPSFIADTTDVYYIDDTEGNSVGDVLFAGNNTSKIWKHIGSIDAKLTGFLRNHNSGLITDPYGRIDVSKNIGVAFTRSDEETGGVWSYLSTYRIYATSFALPNNYLK